MPELDQLRVVVCGYELLLLVLLHDGLVDEEGGAHASGLRRGTCTCLCGSEVVSADASDDGFAAATQTGDRFEGVAIEASNHC